MARKSDPIRYFARICEEYRPNEDPFSEDDQVIVACKAALAKLPDEERRLFILYAEVGNIRKIARILKMSPSTLQYRIARIRKRLQKQVSEWTPRKDEVLRS